MDPLRPILIFMAMLMKHLKTDMGNMISSWFFYFYTELIIFFVSSIISAPVWSPLWLPATVHSAGLGLLLLWSAGQQPPGEGGSAWPPSVCPKPGHSWFNSEMQHCPACCLERGAPNQAMPWCGWDQQQFWLLWTQCKMVSSCCRIGKTLISDFILCFSSFN